MWLHGSCGGVSWLCDGHRGGLADGLMIFFVFSFDLQRQALELPLKFVIKSDCRQEAKAALNSDNYFWPSLIIVSVLVLLIREA